MSSAANRYHPVAMALHWLIAISIIFMIVLGLTMEDITPISTRFVWFQIHKSLGLTILLLSVARLAWRLSHAAPALPSHMSRFEKLAATGAHWALYALMFAIPLSGWLLVSAAAKYPTVFFGLFTVPHLPLPDMDPKLIRGAAGETHEILAIYVAIPLIALHVLAALKHQFIDKDNLFVRMLPRWIAKGE